jgi:hypothetical protein
VNGFIDHLYTRFGTTSNYSATANLHSSQITAAPAEPFPACCVFISRFLAAASNSGDSSASRSQVLSSQPPAQNCLTTSRHGLRRNTPFPTNYIVACVLSRERVYRIIAQKLSLSTVTAQQRVYTPQYYVTFT